jgi:hypothetical protein
VCIALVSTSQVVLSGINFRSSDFLQFLLISLVTKLPGLVQRLLAVLAEFEKGFWVESLSAARMRAGS